MNAELEAARAELTAARSALARADTALERALEAASKAPSNLPSPDVPVSEHRRHHRPGRAPKLDADAELRAFVAARIGLMTFEEIAGEVADHFPPSRHVGRSAIHAWAHRTGAIRR